MLKSFSWLESILARVKLCPTPRVGSSGSALALNPNANSHGGTSSSLWWYSIGRNAYVACEQTSIFSFFYKFGNLPFYFEMIKYSISNPSKRTWIVALKTRMVIISFPLILFQTKLVLQGRHKKYIYMFIAFLNQLYKNIDFHRVGLIWYRKVRLTAPD